MGKGFLTGAISDQTEFVKTDFRNVVPRFAAEARKATHAVPRAPPKQFLREEGILHSCPAQGPEVLWTVPVGRGYGGPVIKDGGVTAAYWFGELAPE